MNVPSSQWSGANMVASTVKLSPRSAGIFSFDTPNLQHIAIECPELTSRLHAYMKAFDLNFGCFDFIVSKNEEAVFLECNCNGQWYWAQERTGQPIGEAIANELLRHACNVTDRHSGPAQQ